MVKIALPSNSRLPIEWNNDNVFCLLIIKLKRLYQDYAEFSSLAYSTIISMYIGSPEEEARYMDLMQNMYLYCY